MELMDLLCHPRCRYRVIMKCGNSSAETASTWKSSMSLMSIYFLIQLVLTIVTHLRGASDTRTYRSSIERLLFRRRRAPTRRRDAPPVLLIHSL